MIFDENPLQPGQQLVLPFDPPENLRFFGCILVFPESNNPAPLHFRSSWGTPAETFISYDQLQKRIQEDSGRTLVSDR